MRAIRIIVTLAIATLIFCASATTVYAQEYITGNLYHVLVNGCNDPIIQNLPDPSLVPLRYPDVTFLVPTYFNGIPLDFNDVYLNSGNLVELWLTHGVYPVYYLLGLIEHCII